MILSMFLLGGVMSRIPLAALAGVLMVTAFRMNEWAVIKQLFQKRLKHSILQFVITMIATVVFDLTLAIIIGVVVAMLIFVLKSCELKIALSDIDEKKLGNTAASTHHNIKMVYLTGPLFFGTQEQLTKALQGVGKLKGIIFSMRGVPSIDDSAINELDELLRDFRAQDTIVLFCGVQPQVMHTMERAGFTEKVGQECFLWDAVTAIQKLDQDLNIIPTPVVSVQ